MRVACIDIGTVTTRLILAEREDGALRQVERRGFVTDLGEGVDATGKFCPSAVERVVEACSGFCRAIAPFGPDLVLTTLTSAARDASNAETLLSALRGLGLSPQIIEGETEAQVTFLGVSGDFPGERIAVVDSGGGSTEVVVGTAPAGSAPAALERVVSLDIGCRRATERFLGPRGAGEDAARAWAREQFAGFWDGVEERPDRLVAVGGTVTTLVAVAHELEPYDSSFVHLHSLSLAEVDGLAERFSRMGVGEIARLKGIEPKRAPVIRAGALVVGELMRSGAYEALTVSENGMLAGLARAACRLLDAGGASHDVRRALT